MAPPARKAFGTAAGPLAAAFFIFLGGSAGSASSLDNVLAAMKAAGEGLRTLQARFEQSNHDFILEQDEVTSGRLYLKVPGEIRWEYDPPQRKVLLVKGEKIQLYNPVSNQLQEFKRGQARGVGADLLIGFGRSNAQMDRNFDVELVGEDATTATLKLVPKPGSSVSVFSAVELTVEKKRWIPSRSVFHEPNRDTTAIVFREMEVNRALPARVFELDLPPNVEIIRQP